jgi:membrane-bound lytic murein transglycosylase D
MQKLIYILFLLPITITAQVFTDTTIQKETKITLGQKLKINHNENDAATDKYNFKPINNSFKSIKTTNIINSFNSQSNLLDYNISDNAQSFLNNYKAKNSAELLRMKSWGGYYLNTMQSILMQYGIPKELVYLAVIETHLNVNLISWAGAAGMWQFMPETGRNYGLQVGYGVDERMDWIKSTHAAAGFLNDLYKQFGDWLLVVAAYNGGPGRVTSAIRRTGSHNFWELQYSLPLESSNHVKKFIGTQLIMQGGDAFSNFVIVDQPKKKFFNPLEKGSIAVDTVNNKMQEYTLNGRYNSLVIAKNIMLDIVSFNTFNPGFDAELAKNTSVYNLRLPTDKMQLFKANQLQIMNESLQLFLTLNNYAPTDYSLPKGTKKKGKKS